MPEWQVPPPNATESRKLGWINESCQEGQLWQQEQRGFSDWRKALDIISGAESEKNRLQYRSNVSGNRLKTNINVAISGLSAIRPWGGFQASGAFAPMAEMMNQVTRALYLSNFWDRDIRAALQWAAATGTGFARPVYRRNMAGQGHGDIHIDAFGMPSVLPVQLPSNGDWQRAYAVTLLDERPIWEAHGMFPDFQDRLTPTSSKYWYASEIRSAAQSNNERRGWHWPFNQKRNRSRTDNLIPLRFTTVNDLSINTTGKTIPMGQYGASWYYEVPSYGSPIPTPGGGFKEADQNDARMYPMRRLIISSENVVLYDGPCFNWSGQLDLIPFCLDRWPWEAMGYSMVHDAYSMQRALDQIDRGIMDKVNADMDRPLAYNMNAVTKREANQVDLMQPRQRIAFDGDVVDKPFQEIAPADVYRVFPEVLNFRKELQADMDYVLQSRDIVELGKARALGKGVDELEALISANGPLVRDMSRNMEQSVCQLADQIKYLVLQYMDTSRMVPYVTDSGVNQVFDYDPASIIPSHMPSENPDEPSVASRIQRAKWFAHNLPFTIAPHSIHELTQMTYRLMLMQLRQRGAPIAWSDIMEANDVPDVKRPKGATTQDRFVAEKEEELEQMIRLSQVAQGVMQNTGVDLSALLGQKNPEGRPPTAQAAPHLEQKGDGRPVISES